MTPERIAEIRARVEAATPGPWAWCPYKMYLLADNAMVCDSGEPEEPGVRMRGAGARLPINQNADFIAHARQDIPELITIVERQAAEIAELKAADAWARGDHQNLVDWLLRERANNNGIDGADLEAELLKRGILEAVEVIGGAW